MWKTVSQHKSALLKAELFPTWLNSCFFSWFTPFHPIQIGTWSPEMSRQSAIHSVYGHYCRMPCKILQFTSHLDFQDEWWIDLVSFSTLKNKGCLTIAKVMHDREVLYNSSAHMPLYRSHAEFLHISAKEPQAWFVIALCLIVLFQSLFQPPKPSFNNISKRSSYSHLMMPQQKIILISIWFSKSSFKNTNVFCMSF